MICKCPKLFEINKLIKGWGTIPRNAKKTGAKSGKVSSDEEKRWKCLEDISPNQLITSYEVVGGTILPTGVVTPLGYHNDLQSLEYNAETILTKTTIQNTSNDIQDKQVYRLRKFREVKKLRRIFG